MQVPGDGPGAGPAVTLAHQPGPRGPPAVQEPRRLPGEQAQAHNLGNSMYRALIRWVPTQLKHDTYEP